MKNLLIAVVALVATSSFAKTVRVSYQDFATKMEEAADGFNQFDECKISVSYLKSGPQAGLWLTLKVDNEEVTLKVSEKSKIRLNEKIANDGSFGREYRVPGKGKVSWTLVDDAAEYFTVENFDTME